MAVLKAGMVDVSWMTHGTLVFILRGTSVRAGNRPTPLMINNSESQNYLINIKHLERRRNWCRTPSHLFPTEQTTSF
jgi:hypothetical protein